MTEIVGLDHVQLAMPAGEETAARAFYGTLLGLPEVAKPAPLAARGGCWFAGPGTAVIHLGVESDFRPARKAHVAFRVRDLARMQAQLTAANVPIVPDDAIPHVCRFFAYDPFGNRLEFIQTGDRF